MLLLKKLRAAPPCLRKKNADRGIFMQKNCTQRKMLEKNYGAGLQKVALLRKDDWWYYVDKSKRKDVK